MFVKVINRKGFAGEVLVNINNIVTIMRFDSILYKIQLANSDPLYIDGRDAAVIFNAIGVSV